MRMKPRGRPVAGSMRAMALWRVGGQEWWWVIDPTGVHGDW